MINTRILSDPTAVPLVTTTWHTNAVTSVTTVLSGTTTAWMIVSAILTALIFIAMCLCGCMTYLYCDSRNRKHKTPVTQTKEVVNRRTVSLKQRTKDVLNCVIIVKST